MKNKHKKNKKMKKENKAKKTMRQTKKKAHYPNKPLPWTWRRRAAGC